VFVATIEKFSAILEAAGVTEEEQQQAVCIAIDKLDKTSRDEVKEALTLNLETEAADFILDCNGEKNPPVLRGKLDVGRWNGVVHKFW